MRTVKFDEDFTFNVTGGANGRLSKEAGDVYSCNDTLADRLVNEWEVASYHDMRPQETKPARPTEQKTKIDFADLPKHEALTSAGYDTLKKVASASDEELRAVNGIGPATLDDIRGFFE